MPGSAKPRAFGLRAGDSLGRYECVAPLAMGGMAEVYLARHRGAAGFEKQVVIKRVLPHLAIDADFVDMFLKEAKLAAALEHPGIAQVIDFGHDGSDYFMVLEYVRGHDLRAVIKAGVRQQDALPLDMAVGIAVESAGALHHAHEQRDAEGTPLGIVHRDVSPSNILLAHTGAVKVIDFGIARAIGVSRTTRAGVVKGKAGYMSPEQCRDEALDRRTDVFGLGILLYEMTTGYRLFHAQSDYAAMNKIAEGRFTPPSEAVPDYPEDLEAIVLRCLALDRSERYATADALRETLEGFALEHRLSLSAAARARVLEGWLGPATDPVTDPSHDLEERPTRVRVPPSAETALPATVPDLAEVGTPADAPSMTPSTPRTTPDTAVMSASETAPTPPPRRTWLLVAVTAGVTGLTVWGASQASNDAPTTVESSPVPDDSPTSAAPLPGTAVGTPHDAPPPTAPAAVAAPDPAPVAMPSEDPKPEEPDASSPEDPTTTPSAPVSDTARARSKPRKSRAKPTSSEPSSAPPKKTLLPPSMRKP